MPPYHWDMRRGLYFVLMVVLVLRGLTGTAMAAGVLPPLLPASAPHVQEHSHLVAAEARRQLVDQGEAGLAEIGYLSGFADQPHFTRQFHAHTGLTPAQYRAQFGPAPVRKSATRR